MRDALIALHFQNDICHPQDRIPFSLNRDTGEEFLRASKRALDAARSAGWTIAHMHIVFAEDYSDLHATAASSKKLEISGLSGAVHGAPGHWPVSSLAPARFSLPVQVIAPFAVRSLRAC
jgi:biuret amidohydrolase